MKRGSFLKVVGGGLSAGVLTVAAPAGSPALAEPQEEAERLRELAATCESIFHRVEKQVALRHPCLRPHYPGSPYEGCFGQWG